MKKSILILALVCLPLAAFADFQIGGAAYLNVPLTKNQIDSNIDLSVDDLQFGADARFNIGILQFQGLMMFQPGNEDVFLDPYINLYTDIGVVFDLAIIRLGAGIGPNFGLSLGENNGDAFNVGANIKLSAEVVLGNLSLGLNWLMVIPDLTVEDVAAAFEQPCGYAGISVLYKLF
jgi:hypothetical protein